MSKIDNCDKIYKMNIFHSGHIAKNAKFAKLMIFRYELLKTTEFAKLTIFRD